MNAVHTTDKVFVTTEHRPYPPEGEGGETPVNIQESHFFELHDAALFPGSHPLTQGKVYFQEKCNSAAEVEKQDLPPDKRRVIIAHRSIPQLLSRTCIPHPALFTIIKEIRAFSQM